MRKTIHREREILEWAESRNILGATGEGTKEAQSRKTNEELTELDDAIYMNDIDGARDAIGDIIVTLAIQANLWGFNLAECIEAAWMQIKDRKGRMIDGVFVKESKSANRRTKHGTRTEYQQSK